MKSHRADWDVTWKFLSTIYCGILGTGMTCILKRCAYSPNRRPKRMKARVAQSTQASESEGAEIWSLRLDSEEAEIFSTSQFLDPVAGLCQWVGPVGYNL
ncbi:hypothetical protein F5Y19DRAFT_326094 [Xylariaceae sp. FL1651]|nr:hypothetical protein F5Y19DRAFT_326094 [Xylariaceae sp. FL1651]